MIKKNAEEEWTFEKPRFFPPRILYVYAYIILPPEVGAVSWGCYTAGWMHD